jgi:hypothetical protein
MERAIHDGENNIPHGECDIHYGEKYFPHVECGIYDVGNCIPHGENCIPHGENKNPRLLKSPKWKANSYQGNEFQQHITKFNN